MQLGAKDDGSSIGSAEHVLGEGGSGSYTNLHLHLICDTDFLVLIGMLLDYYRSCTMKMTSLADWEDRSSSINGGSSVSVFV